MIKSGSENFRKNLKFIPIVFLLIMGKTFFETVEHGIVSPIDIVLVVAMSLVFSVFVISCLSEKAFSLSSPQAFIIIATLIISLGLVISYYFISREILWAALIALVLNLVCRNINFMPVAAVISVVVSLYETVPEVAIAALTGVPAAVGVALVYNSEKLRSTEIWKKIIFAGSLIVMFATSIKLFNVQKFNITFHSLKTEIWDSIASVIAIVILVFLMAYAIKLKKGFAEIFGYITVIAFCVVPMFMEKKFPVVSAMTAFMMLSACSGDGSTADEFFNSVFKNVLSKKKSKA